MNAKPNELRQCGGVGGKGYSSAAGEVIFSGYSRAVGCGKADGDVLVGSLAQANLELGVGEALVAFIHFQSSGGKGEGWRAVVDWRAVVVYDCDDKGERIGAVWESSVDGIAENYVKSFVGLVDIVT